ncbi:MAG: hypothetical protein AAF063_05515 [Cyanobacteria bacterium J06643_5]
MRKCWTNNVIDGQIDEEIFTALADIYRIPQKWGCGGMVDATDLKS